MNMSTCVVNNQRLLAVVPYVQIARPDEQQVSQIVCSYKNLGWKIVSRCENTQLPEYGNFSLLQFEQAEIDRRF